MRAAPRTMAIAAIVGLLVVVAGVIGWRALQDDTRLAGAVALAPEASERLAWTDWAGLRAELDTTVAEGDGEALAEFLDRAYDADLTSNSGIVVSAAQMQEGFGLSPANLSWELLAQTEVGQVLLLGVPEEFDFGALRDRLRDAGYVEPDRAGGTWRADEFVQDELAITPELGNLRLDEDNGLVAASEVPSYLDEVDDSRRGGADDGIGEVVAAHDDVAPLSGIVFSGDQVCSELAMSSADGADNARASQLIADAGEVHPLQGYAMTALPGGALRVAMAFEDADRARTNADTRAQLASGPAPGQGGTFPDRFRLGEVSARDDVVRMELAPVDDTPVLSDLSSGPVLFATC